MTALFKRGESATVPIDDCGPFGEVIRLSGPAAKLNPFRFSTKYYDDETDLIYYGYRYYRPSTGTWLSRDPIDEASFRQSYMKSLNFYGRLALQDRMPDGNEFAFLQNDPIDNYDVNGLFPPVILIFTVGNGVCHGILACYDCKQCLQCTSRATDLINWATQHMDADQVQQWLTTVKPGAECAPLCADCGKQSLLFGKWVVGGVVIKYGIRLAASCYKPGL